MSDSDYYHNKSCGSLAISTSTRKDLIDRIAGSTQASRALVKDTVLSFFDEIICELARHNRLEFRDFGIFEVRQASPRTAQNPKTVEPIEVPARRRVKFQMGRILRERMVISSPI